MDGKPIWQSKTFWAGLITTAVSILALFQGADFITDNPTAVAIIGMAVGILNIILRAITGEQVTLFGRSLYRKSGRTRMKY